jgi:uncharacterized protein YjlB
MLLIVLKTSGALREKFQLNDENCRQSEYCPCTPVSDDLANCATGASEMFIVESLKQKMETLTGAGKPSLPQAQAMLRAGAPETWRFLDDRVTPNNPLPFLIYRTIVHFEARFDPAAVLEVLFGGNGWGRSWRNGIYDYLHYHSQVHEVLGIARGQGRVRFGGDHGIDVDLAAGDVAVLPAGTGHQRLTASADLLVVGAYPPAGRYDECRGKPDEHARALRTIPQVPLPPADPLFGADGPLCKLWMK